MSTFRLPGNPKGTTLIRGVRFVDGKSGNVKISDATREYFKNTGVTEVKQKAAADSKPVNPATQK